MAITCDIASEHDEAAAAAAAAEEDEEDESGSAEAVCPEAPDDDTVWSGETATPRGGSANANRTEAGKNKLAVDASGKR